MDITEKVLQLKQDFDNVYAAGRAAGGGGSATECFCHNAEEISFRSFNDFARLDENGNPLPTPVVELTLPYLRTLNNFITITSTSPLEYINNTVEHFILTSNTPIVDCYGAFGGSNSRRNEKLKRLTLNIDLSAATTVRSMFAYCSGLETIDGTPLNFSSAVGSYATTTTFVQCEALKEVRFVEKSIQQSLEFKNSPNLSTDTIQSIIEGLADLTGGTAQTLDFHSDVVDKLTDDQFTQIANKNWDVT